MELEYIDGSRECDMGQKLNGLEYLKANQINHMYCDENKPYAFISYSHDDEDSQIVMNVFRKLSEKGFNLWIDLANMPHDENSWKQCAEDALMRKECKLAFFFRSETSLIKETILEELQNISDEINEANHMEVIVAVDIWHEDDMDAKKYLSVLRNDRRMAMQRNDNKCNKKNKRDSLSICKDICQIVRTDCKAIRLKEDMNSNIFELVNEMADILSQKGIKPEPKILSKEQECKNLESTSPIMNISDERGKISLSDFLIQYNNKSFKKTTFYKFKLVGCNGYERYGTDYFDSAYQLSWSFVMCLIEEKGMQFIKLVNKNHPKMKNPIFISQEEYERLEDKKKYRKIEGNCSSTYYMYRNYSQYDWIDSVLKQRLRDLEIPIEDFHFEYIKEKTTTEVDTTELSDIPKDDENKRERSKKVIDCYIYSLWGNEYSATKLSTMMHDVFDLIAKKYPERILTMARDNGITAVAYKSDVDNKNLPESKLNYFSAKKEHKVGEQMYYVSTRYNREQGIKQLEKMLQICEGTSEKFYIISSPQKFKKNIKNGKKGLDEIL